ncbi:hypothetical protein V1288_002004 [Bradyrhizobium sp. AZCC 2176]
MQLEKQLSEQSLKDEYETQIKDRDDAIERLKDMKSCNRVHDLRFIANRTDRLWL